MLFELNNTDDLRQQIEYLFTEPDLLADLKKNIPAVKSIDEEMRELLGLYDNLVEAK